MFSWTYPRLLTQSTMIYCFPIQSTLVCVDWTCTGSGVTYKRRQFVSYNSHHSAEEKKQTISCGVPQGSVLGPQLCIIYVNDICNSSDKLSFCLFADDTSLSYNHQNVDQAIQDLNVELVKDQLYYFSLQDSTHNLSRCSTYFT